VSLTPKTDMRGTYVGPSSELAGKKALLRTAPEGQDYVLAQFDDTELPHNLTHAWTKWPRSSWRVQNMGD
jgi:hypothetical protein